MSVDGSTPWRKGLEALAIALYRVAYQCSPTVNFGRMPAGYRMSSGNTATLVSAGKRYTGSYTGENTTSHLASISPVGSLSSDHQSTSWCGHTWSTWCSLQAAFTLLNPQANGLYCIKHSGTNQLLYIGEGLIITVVRVSRAAAADTKRDPRGSWFWWLGGALPPLAEVATFYPHRFGQEHGYRVDNQQLVWDAAHVRTPKHMQRWADVVAMVRNQLLLARPLVIAARRPWESATRRVTPQQVRRALARLLGGLAHRLPRPNRTEKHPVGSWEHPSPLPHGIR